MFHPSCVPRYIELDFRWFIREKSNPMIEDHSTLLLSDVYQHLISLQIGRKSSNIREQYVIYCGRRGV